LAALLMGFSIGWPYNLLRVARLNRLTGLSGAPLGAR